MSPVCIARCRYFTVLILMPTTYIFPTIRVIHKGFLAPFRWWPQLKKTVSKYVQSPQITIVPKMILQNLNDVDHRKTCLKRSPKKKTQNFIFKTDNRLMQVKSIAECYTFRPVLSYHLSLRPMFCLFLNGC